MANPIIHAESSVKNFGGHIDDYLAIHEKMDCSKAYFSDNRHRALTHTLFWVREVMIPIFGSYIEVIKNGHRVKVSVKDICERHILEDFKMKYIPTVQDFLQEMDFKGWMQNGAGIPDSAKRIYPELYELNGIKEQKSVQDLSKAEKDIEEQPHKPEIEKDKKPSDIAKQLKDLFKDKNSYPKIVDGNRGGTWRLPPTTVID